MAASIEPRPSAGSAALLAAPRGFRVHDAAPVIEPGMPLFVAYPQPEITPLFGHDEVGAAADRIALAEHTGTQLDAPLHCDRDGATVDELAPAVLRLRPCKKFDLSTEAPEPGHIRGGSGSPLRVLLLHAVGDG